MSNITPLFGPSTSESSDTALSASTAANTNEPFMVTASGYRFPLLSPTADDVYLLDLAVQLANQCRFNGAVQPGKPYSVAQYSVLVADLVENINPDLDVARYALLHDAHETYVGDIISPVERALARLHPASAKAIQNLKKILDRSIFEAFGLEFPVPPSIRDICPLGAAALYVTPGVPLPPPLGTEIKVWPALEAAKRFEDKALALFTDTATPPPGRAERRHLPLRRHPHHGRGGHGQ